MGIWEKLKARRAERTAEKEAIEHEREESLRVDDAEQSQHVRSPFDEGFMGGLKQ